MEKFYFYTEWLEYLIEKIFKPKGITLNGVVKWNGEEDCDIGSISIKYNVVTAKEASIEY